MISIILSAIFLVFIVGTGAAATMFFKKKKTKQAIVPCVFAAVFAVLLLIIPFSIHTVNAGEVAVVKHLGKADKIRTAGTYFDFWLTETYDIYDAKVQNLFIIITYIAYF